MLYLSDQKQHTMTTASFIILKCICVALFAFTVFGFFRFVNKQINELKPKEEPSKEPFTSFGWVFFKHVKSGSVYAYNAVELNLTMSVIRRQLSNAYFEIQGENVHKNLDIQKYLFDKAKGIEFTFKTITRDEFMSVYNNK